MKTELICICCPLGCRITVSGIDNNFDVSGNACPRGKQYALEEITLPKRMVTSSVLVHHGDCQMVSVKTSEPIDKKLIFSVLETLKGITLDAPIKIGDIVKENVLGTSVNFVATRNVGKVL